MLVGGVVVTHNMQLHPGWAAARPRKSTNSVFVCFGVALVRGQLPGRDVQPGEERPGPGPGVVVWVLAAGLPCSSGWSGPVRSNAWSWDFSSTLTTTAFSGGDR